MEYFSVPLISRDGVRGQILTTSQGLDLSVNNIVTLDSGRKLQVAANLLHRRPDGSFYLDLIINPPAPTDLGNNGGLVEEVVIPRIEEELEITQTLREIGKVRLTKTVGVHNVTVDELISYQTYEVQRIPINQPVDAPEGPRVEGDVTIFPIYEEEIVVTKRLILREEIHVISKKHQEQHVDTVSLRKDDIKVERF